MCSATCVFKSCLLSLCDKLALHSDMPGSVSSLATDCFSSVLLNLVALPAVGCVCPVRCRLLFLPKFMWLMQIYPVQN